MAFQILSLSGGGFLGLYSISVLAELEDALGRPLATCFDLIAGTSVGGMIALGLALEVPAADIKTAFELSGARILSNRSARTTRLAVWRDFLKCLRRPKYGDEVLRGLVTKILGESTTLAELNHAVLIPAFNLTKGRPHLFKSPHLSGLTGVASPRVVEVALAATAVPVYFPLARIGGDLFIDGGLYATAPDLLALHEAEQIMGIPLGEIRVLSIGTTTSRFALPAGEKRRLGLIDWMKGQRLVRTIMASQQIQTEAILQDRLGDNYLRIDDSPAMKPGQGFPLDVATARAQREIEELAAFSVSRFVQHPRLAAILAHRAPARQTAQPAPSQAQEA